MGSIPLPALSIKPPAQQENPADAYGKMLSLQDLVMRNKQQQIALQDNQAMTAAMHDWDGKDLNALPSLVLGKGGSAQAVLGLKSKILEQQKTYSDMAKNDSETGSKNLETLKTKNDLVAGKIDSILAQPDEKLHESLVSATQEAATNGLIDPAHVQQMQQLGSLPPDQLRTQLSLVKKGYMADSQIHSQAVADYNAESERIKANRSGPEGELPLGVDRVSQYNDLFKQRFAVLNPTKPLPATYQLPANATQKDFERVDKMLESNERATATKAQQDTVNAIREQTANAQNVKFDADDPMVNLVGTGKMDLGTATARMNAQTKDNFVKAVASKYGDTFKQSTYGVEKKVEEKYTSGNVSDQLLAIGTAREHMKTFTKLADALDNGDVQLLNKIGNQFGIQFGSDKATNFRIAQEAFGGEVGKAFDGAGVVAGEREDTRKAYNDAMSKGQFKGAVQIVDELLAGKQTAAKKSYEAGKQGRPNFGDQQNNPPGMKIGDPVMIKGKAMKVTALHPDGSFDAQ